ncbi:MAG: hypothetical protein ACR2NX_02230 [Chthoniobacterales bacterium]
MKMLSLFTAVVLASAAGAFAQQQRPISIEVIASFDYPGEGNSTSAQGINDQGDITGSYDDTNGVTRGFVRYSNGAFSEPIVEPNDAAGFTFPRDINNSVTLGGTYADANDFLHGFLLSGTTYIEVDFPGSDSTTIGGLNDAGDVVGDFTVPGAFFEKAFAEIGGTATPLEIPRAKAGTGYGINNRGEIVGNYTEIGTGRGRGFFRAADGTVTAPIEPRGSIFAFISCINESGVIVGRYTSADGVRHGLVMKLPHSSLTFDYPGAIFTSVSGINNQGYVTGRFQNDDGIFHSYLGRVRFGR